MREQVSKLLILLMVFTFVKGLFWVFTTPIFQAPDEPQHYSYVQYLVEKRRIPKIKELDFKPSERLAVQMQILETRDIAHNAHIQHSYYRAASDIHPHEALKSLENLNATPSEINYIHNYGPLYYLLNVPIYLIAEPSLPWQVYGMRAFSVLLSCLTVLLVFLSARLLFDRWNFPLLFGLFFTLHPQFSFVSASINNDNLIILLFTLFFYLATKWWGQNLTVQKVLLLIGIGFLGFITKTHGIILGFLIFMYLLLDFLRRMDLKKILLAGFALLAGILASASIFFQQIAKGFLQNPNAINDYFNEHGVLWFLKTITLTRLFRTYKSFFGRYGWLDTLMPEWAYYLFFALMLPALMGLVVFFMKSKDKKLKSIMAFFIFSILVVDFTYTLLFAKNAILFDYYNFPIQGRYYFIVLLPILFLMFLGLSGLSKKYVKPILYGSVYLMFFVHIIALFALIPIRYYL